MKKTVLLAVSLAFILALLFPGIPGTARAENEKLDGKAVFLKYKCETCHSVSTAGIEGKLKAIKAPDQVDVTVRHEQPWIHAWIRQDVGHIPCPKVDSSRDGEKHVVKFAGNKAEEDALIDWLDQQRSQ
ncbi:MAG: hypothetical protein A2945_00535 [Candidatus Liptonbacteria bacterium RIFCSPLOWO2_01_FULL_52_25]|uniref:Cytochrome c domain-containing protein n=1 Tax=Candidatus Liptonbacteria bacterium RIFCSPLOWO2_01_FULL_52_25 TaxID=1798650 RepID=A0A1G2CH52_9BACT|nr:MAG: hypothetical protein A2945_00535 [Candidatus Liptonbacteria bacterium RIFCSPLOWO2_01_FULL_52_25]